jgi:hypothetical protein
LSEIFDELAKAFDTIGSPRIVLSVMRAKIGDGRLCIFRVKGLLVKFQNDLLVLRFRGRFLRHGQRTTTR